MDIENINLDYSCDTDIECVVVDAGARYGIHPTWEDWKHIVDLHLFEMDANEARRLEIKYKKHKNIRVYPLALYYENKDLFYNSHKHRALSSIHEVDTNFIRENDYLEDEFTQEDRQAVRAVTLDTQVNDREVHFLKLDVEGSELDVLKGAARHLNSSVIGVRSEVAFESVFKDGQTFCDIHTFLLKAGFELINFDYTGEGNKYGRFTLPARYGKLISTDAVWVARDSTLYTRRSEDLEKNQIRKAAFLLSNHATDLALEVLLTLSANTNGLERYMSSQFFINIEEKVRRLFKQMINKPQTNIGDLLATYKRIFKKDFPTLHRYYEE